jgi:transposase InsO family protein
LQQRAISRLPEVGGDKPAKKRFKRYPIGYFHIDLAEVRTAEGKLNLFVAIDRTSKFAFVRLEKRAGKMEAAQFLRDLLQAPPYRIHTVLTDNGIQFTNRALDARAFAHIFDRVCRENGFEHRLTKVRHPWTNGQVEPTESHDQGGHRQTLSLRRPQPASRRLADFIDAYNHARRLKALSGRTPYEFVCKCWTSKPDRFILNPIYQMPGLNT